MTAHRFCPTSNHEVELPMTDTSASKTPGTPQVNWAGNYRYRAPRWHRPETIGELQDVVARSTQAKALGSRHCFNDIADTPGDLIDRLGENARW